MISNSHVPQQEIGNCMKMLCAVLFFSMMITNVKAGEPENKNFHAGSFSMGIGVAWGAPLFVFGSYACHLAKKDLKKVRCWPEDWRRIARYHLSVGRYCKGIGAGLVVVPLLVNNRQLLADRAGKFYDRLSAESKRE